MRQIFCGMLALVLLLLSACGGKGTGNTVAKQLQNPTAAQQNLPDSTEHNIEQQLESLAAPSQVDNALWIELKQTLVRAIQHVQAQKRPAHAPAGMINEVTNLVVVVENDGSATFSWSYRNTGDYNQDSEVGVSDLTSIAVNWYANANDGENDASDKVVDGDSNGEVSGSDISVIAIHFASTVDGYTLQVRYVGSEDWLDIVAIPFETGQAPAAGGWLNYEHNLQSPSDGASYRVVPYFGETPGSLGQPSAEVEFDASSLGRPQNLSATEGTIAGSIELSWSPMEGAATFRIFTSETDAGSFELLDSTTPLKTTYLHTDLNEGQQVWYKVQGLLTGGVTPFSSAVKGSTMIRPGMVENLTVSDALFFDHTHLDWDPMPAAAEYKAYRSDVSGGPYSEIYTGVATSFDDFDVTPGTPYFYTVAALNEAGAGAQSVEATGRAAIPGDPPTVVSVNPRIGAAGSSVEFSALISGGPVETYIWQFGGGATPAASPDASPTVTLGAVGEYSATLTVSNLFGQHIFPFSLDVGNPPEISGVTPVAGISAENITLVPTFQGSADSWAWDFNGAGTPATSDLEQPELLLGAGGEYLANVQATNQYGTDGFDFTLTVLAPPSRPDWLLATDGIYTGWIRLSWAPGTLASGYLIYRDSQDTPVATVGNITTWDDTSLEARDYNVHTYWVVSTNVDGTSDFSDPDTGYIKLSAPEDLLATSGTLTDRVRLFWTESSGASGYQIYRDNTTSAYASVGSVDTWDDMGVADYSSHEYWISATNANPGESDLSLSDNGFLGINAPTGVTASEGDFTDKINLSWTQSSGATNYKVYRDGTGEGSLVSGELGDVATWDDTTVNDHSSHDYYLRGFNPLTQSALSSVASGFRGLAAPGNFAASDAGSTDNIALTWTAVTGAVDYKIYRGTDTNLVHTTSSGDGSTVQWNDLSIGDYETYDYWIKAYNANGDGFASHDSGFLAFPSSWDSHTIDNSGVVGNWTSLQHVDGKPAVSYFSTGGGIKYARSSTSSPTQTSDWTYHTVDGLPLPGGDNLGNLGADLAELNGKPIIAYHNAFPGDLQIAKADIAAPSSAADWTVYVVDSTNDVGTYPAVLVIDGYVAICYRDHTVGSIKFAMAKELDPLDGSSTYWDVYTLDNSANLGYEGIDLAEIGGVPVATYFDLTNGDLKYARASVAQPSNAGQWSISQVATTNVVGKWPSLAVMDGKPAVSFSDVGNTNLLFARATVATPSGTGDWVSMDVDTGGSCGDFGTSLLVVGGRPSIAYFFDGTQDLKYANAYSALPATESNWYLLVVDSGASTGYYPSQIWLNSQPALTYRGGDFLMFTTPSS